MTEIDCNSPSVQSYLTILQDLISRMAGNSAGSKTWCIALVSAILILVADKASPYLVGVAIAPIVVFCILDAYYLALEKSFRDRYNSFIRKLHAGKVEVDELFVLSPLGACHTLAGTWRAMSSFSVWPFYLIQILVLVAVRFLVLPLVSPPA